jgi:thioredoxin reductase
MISSNLRNHPIAIIGAGPYGLSIAAHLRAAGVDFRIFGKPMSRWRHHMPQGMFLKSEGFASNLSDPAGTWSLAQYCAEAAIPYGDTKKPVPLEVFVEYALAFQKTMAPEVEEVLVNRIEDCGGLFELQLASGETARARQVIVATGLEHAAYIPPELAGLPADLLSHSCAHHDLSRFSRKDVAVVGRGQSALETAALLSEQGANVQLVVRESSLSWAAPPAMESRSIYQRFRRPSSGLGSGLQLWAYVNAPTSFRYLPRSIRFNRVKNVLGPQGAWWLRRRVEGSIETLLGHAVLSAEALAGRAQLTLRRADGQVLSLLPEHVIAATGYRFSLDRVPFLSEGLKSQIKSERESPVLSEHFESSVPGLYFTGIASAPSFGPLMRFLFGTEFTARRLTRRLASSASAFARAKYQQVGAD